MDIFSFANDAPYRIELSGDEVESIRTFDTANQLSLQNFDKAAILPNIQEQLSEGKSASIIDYILAITNDLYLWMYNENNILSAIDEGLKSVLEKEATDVFISGEELKNEFSKIPVIEFGPV